MMGVTRDAGMVARSLERDLSHLEPTVQVIAVCALAAVTIRKHAYFGPGEHGMLDFALGCIRDWVAQPAFEKTLEIMATERATR